MPDFEKLSGETAGQRRCGPDGGREEMSAKRCARTWRRGGGGREGAGMNHDDAVGKAIATFGQPETVAPMLARRTRSITDCRR